MSALHMHYFCQCREVLNDVRGKKKSGRLLEQIKQKASLALEHHWMGSRATSQLAAVRGPRELNRMKETTRISGQQTSSEQDKSWAERGIKRETSWGNCAIVWIRIQLKVFMVERLNWVFIGVACSFVLFTLQTGSSTDQKKKKTSIKFKVR